MTYLADPGGRFASDTHRRVLGHLPLPTDTYGWRAAALLYRMMPDVGSTFKDPEELLTVLGELQEEGLAEVVGPGAWRMTEKGFDTITMGIVNEPGPGAGSTTPAMISEIGAATQLGPTEIGGSDAAN